MFEGPLHTLCSIYSCYEIQLFSLTYIRGKCEPGRRLSYEIMCDIDRFDSFKLFVLVALV